MQKSELNKKILECLDNLKATRKVKIYFILFLIKINIINSYFDKKNNKSYF